MKKIGGLIFAHNSEQLDYILLSTISAGLAKKNLQIPFTLITDNSTLEWAKTSGIYPTILEIFEDIKFFEVQGDTNQRRLLDGQESMLVPFTNSSRSAAYRLSPYDRTLLIDSDFLINSKNLLPYLDSQYPMMIPEAINPLDGSEIRIHDKYVADAGIRLLWATCMIFDKTEENELLFSLIDRIRTNYELYGHLYGYNNILQYRNDIAFSIAIHVMSGFVEDRRKFLPPILTSFDRDILIDVEENRYTFLVENSTGSSSYVPCSCKDLDIHVMNKQSIVRNKDKLMGMI